MRKQKKSTEIDFFDINNIEDLPDECQKQINKPILSCRLAMRTQQFIQLFKLKPFLTTKEIVAAMYRIHKVIVTKAWVSQTGGNLAKRGLIQIPKNGVYKIVLEVPDRYKSAFEEIINVGGN